MHFSWSKTVRMLLPALCLAGFFTAGTFSSPAQAYTPDETVRYAAIALNDWTGAYGYTYNYDTREEAERAAIRRAGSGSRIILSTTRAYFAFAQAPLGGWGTGTGDTPEEAKNQAMNNALKHSLCPKIKFCEYNGWRY